MICLFFIQTQRKSGCLIDTQLCTLSTFNIQICKIDHLNGSVKGWCREMPPSCLCLHLNFWSSCNRSLSLSSALFHPSPHLALSPRLPAPLVSRISESQCILNCYALVSYGYNLQWHARVPFPFSALHPQYQCSLNVQSVHKASTQRSADTVQTSALTHALHSVLCIIIVI